MTKRIIKSFSDLEKEWVSHGRPNRLIVGQSGLRNDDLLFWFWFAIAIVLCVLFPISGVISFAFWFIIFRHKIRGMIKKWLH